MGLQYAAASFDPSPYPLLRQGGGAGGASATHIDCVLERGEQGAPSRTQTFSEARFGKFKLQESSFAHVGMDPSQANDCSARLTQQDFSSKLVPLETSPAP